MRLTKGHNKTIVPTLSRTPETSGKLKKNPILRLVLPLVTLVKCSGVGPRPWGFFKIPM